MAPKVSIGVPVYNGQNYLRDALDSILGQSYGDFEVIISDNASTDGTAEICGEYEKRDPRVRYRRNGKNLGAAGNFNRVFELSRGEYFKWAAHDDVLHRDFLLRCVEVLDNDPGISACFSKIVVIDSQGRETGFYEYDNEMSFDSHKPHERFSQLMDMRHWCIKVFGLIRRSALEGTPLIASFVGSDRTLMAEVGLKGRIHRVPEYLFFRRDHPECSMESMKLPQTRIGWFDTSKEGALNFPNWRFCREFFSSVMRVPLKPSEKARCCLEAARWCRKRRRWLLDDLRLGLWFYLQRSRQGRKLLEVRRGILNKF